jgi:hypothetical protein
MGNDLPGRLDWSRLHWLRRVDPPAEPRAAEGEVVFEARVVCVARSRTVTLAGQVNNYANPTLVELSNTGDLMQDHATHYTLDLGVALVDQVVQSIAGDLNYDGMIDFDDMSGFVLGLNDPAAYQWQFGRPAHLAGDMDGDGDLDFDDISGFVTALSSPPLMVESHSVPEPSAIALVAIATIASTMLRSGRTRNADRLV